MKTKLALISLVTLHLGEAMAAKVREAELYRREPKERPHWKRKGGKKK